MSAESAQPAPAAAAAPRRSGPLPWLKPAVFTGAMIPLVVLVYRRAAGSLQADYIAEILNQCGMLALIFLIASLACTPLKLLSGWTWPLRIRRRLGVLAFFYAGLHFMIYFGMDQGWRIGNVLDDISDRKFILAGFSALVLMLPLALTSTNKMIALLGATRWQRLHRLAYVAGILAVLHFYWRVKLDVTEPLVYGGVLAALLLVRVVYKIRARGDG